MAAVGQAVQQCKADGPGQEKCSHQPVPQRVACFAAHQPNRKHKAEKDQRRSRQVKQRSQRKHFALLPAKGSQQRVDKPLQTVQVQPGKGHISLILEVIFFRQHLCVDHIPRQRGSIRRKGRHQQRPAGGAPGIGQLLAQGIRRRSIHPAEQRCRHGKRNVQDEQLPRPAQCRRKAEQHHARRRGQPPPAAQNAHRAPQHHKADGNVRNIVKALQHILAVQRAIGQHQQPGPQQAAVLELCTAPEPEPRREIQKDQHHAAHHAHSMPAGEQPEQRCHDQLGVERPQLSGIVPVGAHHAALLRQQVGKQLFGRHVGVQPVECPAAPVHHQQGKADRRPEQQYHIGGSFLFCAVCLQLWQAAPLPFLG